MSDPELLAAYQKTVWSIHAPDGTVQYDWVAADTLTAGNYYAEFQVNWADGTKTSFPNNGNFLVKITAELA